MATVPDMAAVGKDIKTQLKAKAPLASPTFTGTPKAPTAVAGTKTTQVATTAFVQAEISAFSSEILTALKELIVENGGTVPKG